MRAPIDAPQGQLHAHASARCTLGDEVRLPIDQRDVAGDHALDTGREQLGERALVTLSIRRVDHDASVGQAECTRLPGHQFQIVSLKMSIWRHESDELGHSQMRAAVQRERAILAASPKHGAVHVGRISYAQIRSYCAGKFAMPTNCGFCGTSELSNLVNAPVLVFTENEVTLPDSLATNISSPFSDRVKLRGTLPPEGVVSMNVSLPVAVSIENRTMLSCPRFEPYTNFPDGATTTSAHVFDAPSVPAGKVDLLSKNESRPSLAS